MEQDRYSILKATQEVLAEDMQEEWASIGKTYLQMKKYYDGWSVLARKTEEAIKELASQIGLSSPMSSCSCEMYCERGDMIIEVTFEGCVFLLFQLNRFANIVSGGDAIGVEFKDNHLTMKINVAETMAYYNALSETEDKPIEGDGVDEIKDCDSSVDDAENSPEDEIPLDENGNSLFESNPLDELLAPISKKKNFLGEDLREETTRQRGR